MQGVVRAGLFHAVYGPFAPRIGLLALLGGALVLLLLLAPPFPGREIGAVIASALLSIWLVLSVKRWLDRRRSDAATQSVMDLLRIDATAAVVTDAGGKVLVANPVALKLLRNLELGSSLALVLERSFAAPGQMFTALLMQARAKGHAWQDHGGADGPRRLSAFELGPDRYVWRFERLETAQPESEHMSLPAIVLDDGGRLLAANRSLEQLLGCRVSRLSEAITDLPLRPGDVHQIATSSGGTQKRVLTMESEDGNCSLFLLPADTAGVAVSEDWSLFDSIPVPLLKITTSGEVVQANRSARELLDDQMPLGRHLQDLVAGLGRPIQDWLSDAANGRGLNQSEFLQLVGDNQEVFIQVTLKPVEDGDGTALVAVLNDATELKTLEGQFVQSQKMQAIGQLAGGVAHDFNNLLTAISGHCDLLLMRHDEGDPNYGDLMQIHQNANRAASLVGQLLAFSRKQTLQPKVMDLRDAMSDLTHLLNRLVGEKIRLSLQLAPDLPAIRADKRQFEQVIMNLVVNARDAMPDGGKIEISTRLEHLDQELRRNRAVIPCGSYAVIKVTDHGQGISPEQLPKIFEPFFTTKRTGEGTGLGLSTAYGIIKQSGGFIFADSALEKGSVFTIYLPAHSEAQPAAKEQKAAARPSASASKGAGVILLVEDEAPVRAFASRALRLRGYTVLEAENAEEALKRLSDRSLDVDLFVSDMVMPGMDGPSWVREALKTRPNTRVVFMSGYAEDALSDQQARIPNSVFLPKPFSLQDLTATVQQQLH
ncbi:MAG: ATP-binding protein [Mangrovicoccus sp.]|nr:ATP-binding protein [Mangrovicoccus sp.]